MTDVETVSYSICGLGFVVYLLDHMQEACFEFRLVVLLVLVQGRLLLHNNFTQHTLDRNIYVQCLDRLFFDGI